MKRVHLTWQDLERAGHALVAQMFRDGWRPERVVGLTPGGLPLAVLVGNIIDVPVHALGVNLYSKDPAVGCESNAWMSEDAFGYDGREPTRTLIINDANETGATFRWIMQDWNSSCLPNDPAWGSIWGNSVRFAAMVENVNSDFDLVNYSYIKVGRAETPDWYVFPWEYPR